MGVFRGTEGSQYAALRAYTSRIERIATESCLEFFPCLPSFCTPKNITLASHAQTHTHTEYERYARLMTSLHAQQPSAKRPHGPLTASGANAGNSSSGNAADGSSGGGGGAQTDGSPVKKAKPERTLAATKVKKSLKRL